MVAATKATKVRAVSKNKPAEKKVTVPTKKASVLARYLSGDTMLYVCHDYPPDGREPACRTSVAAQRSGNIHVRDGVEEGAFVTMRRARDKTLAIPALMLPSLQVNIRAGRLPPPDANGTAYLRIPLNRF
ncbi:hypothetical protein CBM2623_B90009 [Cupriavidus taiwanensis]|nr:hypothetical protein CBM2608_B100008 [Cupriavidus taiwanensis]SPA36584.1 hypothetical protein CBM2623_B90009 [Cupriavidus taiwanensis]